MKFNDLASELQVLKKHLIRYSQVAMLATQGGPCTLPLLCALSAMLHVRAVGAIVLKEDGASLLRRHLQILTTNSVWLQLKIGTNLFKFANFQHMQTQPRASSSQMSTVRPQTAPL